MPRSLVSRLLMVGAAVLAVAALLGYGRTATLAAPSAKSLSPMAELHRKSDKKGGKAASSAEKLGGELQKTAQEIAVAKSDLAAVQGQVDAGAVQALITQAESLENTARGLQSQADIAKAAEYAHAAHETAEAARQLMVAGVGGPLPSQTNPLSALVGQTKAPKLDKKATSTSLSPPLPGADQATIDAYRQTESGGDLWSLYEKLDKAASTAQANPPTEVAGLLATARSLYRQAYEQYQAGQYVRAAGLARAGKEAAGGAEHLLRAAGAAPTRDPKSPPVPLPDW